MPGRMCYRSPSVNGWHRAKRQAHSANKLKLPFIEIMRFTALLHAPCAMLIGTPYSSRIARLAFGLLTKPSTIYLTDMTVPLVIILSSSGVNLKTAWGVPAAAQISSYCSRSASIKIFSG